MPVLGLLATHIRRGLLLGEVGYAVEDRPAAARRDMDYCLPTVEVSSCSHQPTPRRRQQSQHWPALALNAFGAI
ncbi:hypothetical protein Agabi119p4_466 [Agaricus bisporus var. burnettii]|uniref:Uncharacterized protein n=1 Tax=Agaricus bisporus var. burnettii TaxID=192524 RepID=A0A8H7KKZ6_AGABI|nr:hypothetical protein Agabi119p4_466 [Agaricus bisporus var. burnettii]